MPYTRTTVRMPLLVLVFDQFNTALKHNDGYGLVDAIHRMRVVAGDEFVDRLLTSFLLAGRTELADRIP
jgi:hypothetical protein